MATWIFRLIVLALLVGNLLLSYSIKSDRRFNTQYERLRAVQLENKMRDDIAPDILARHPNDLEAAITEQRNRSQKLQEDLDNILEERSRQNTNRID